MALCSGRPVVTRPMISAVCCILLARWNAKRSVIVCSSVCLHPSPILSLTTKGSSALRNLVVHLHHPEVLSIQVIPACVKPITSQSPLEISGVSSASHSPSIIVVTAARDISSRERVYWIALIYPKQIASRIRSVDVVVTQPTRSRCAPAYSCSASSVSSLEMREIVACGHSDGNQNNPYGTLKLT